MDLSQLHLGQTAQIIDVSQNISLKEKLCSWGICLGSKVKITNASLTGNNLVIEAESPKALVTTFCIRKDNAKQILIKLIE